MKRHLFMFVFFLLFISGAVSVGKGYAEIDLTLGSSPSPVEKTPEVGGIPDTEIPDVEYDYIGVLDDFNRPDGPIGGYWTIRAGAFNIVSNAVQGGPYALATYNGVGGNVVEADVEVTETSLQYVGIVLGYKDNDNNLFFKVQQQNRSGKFEYAACKVGNNGSNFGLGFFPLVERFSKARMRVELTGDVATITFYNIDGGTGSQTYTCAGAPETGGYGIGINALNASFGRLDNFSVPNLLYNNGPMITHPMEGADGNAASALQTDLGMETYGFNANISNGYSMADEFTVTGDGWTITEMHFFAYQINSLMTSTINDLRTQIYDGPPNAGGVVIWGDLLTNRLTATDWTGIYRVNITNLLKTNRPIMRAIVRLETPLSLPPGTYWVEFQLGGDPLLMGPYVPPITILGQTTTGNALNKTTDWLNAIDSGTRTQQGMPFLIFGYNHPFFLRMAVKGSTNNNIYISKMSWGGWDSWEMLSGATSHAPAMVEFKDRLYMAVKGATNNNIYIRYMDSSGVWSSWSILSGATTLSPALVVFNNRLYLFVKGATNNNIYYCFMDTSGNWSSWSMVPGGTTSDKPNVIVYEEELWLIVKGATNNNIYMKRMNSSGSWSSWEQLDSGATSTAPASVVYNGHGYLFVKGGTNNNIYYMRDDWSYWEVLSGATTRTPSVWVNPEDGRLYLAVKGATNDNIYIRYMDSSGAWSSWYVKTGATSDTPVLCAY